MSPTTEYMVAPHVTVPLSFFARSMTAMSILQEDGLILFINNAGKRMFSNPPAIQPPEIGMNIIDHAPGDFGRERVAMLRELARTEQDALVRSLWRGEQLLTHIRIMPRMPDQTLRAFLMVHQHFHGPVDETTFAIPNYIDPQSHDLGPLALLSPRELEVLALLGEGLTAAQIAARISRSEDTVNTHRGSLLRKLKVQNASQLAVIAHRAGLKYDG